jgi:threonine synthase
LSVKVASRLACAGCGDAPGARDAYPFRCPRAGSDDGADHVLTRVLDLEPERFAPQASHPRFAWDDAEHPFVRFRTLLHAYHRARAGGMLDGEFAGRVAALDARVAAVDGRGFRVTPFAPSPALGVQLGVAGGLWIKDETENVAGSHKARHLFGILLHLEVAEGIGLTSRAESDRRGLAIASCGNAALAAAVLARASERPLGVFIPTDADPRVVERLKALGARITVCPRRGGERGDPCMHEFRRAVAAGALPFCCQGSENGLTIEGGETLAWEIASSLASEGATLDRLFVQVGGGALASATVQGLREAKALGAIQRLPRIHPVQTRGAHPLRRAYERVRARICEALGARETGDEACADLMREAAGGQRVRDVLHDAQLHRARFMWPWEETPHSVAHGILDDETYDWHAVVAGVIETGGWPVTAGEDALREARALAHDVAGIHADHTGAAGLAGLIALRGSSGTRPHESAAILMTGIERRG